VNSESAIDKRERRKVRKGYRQLAAGCTPSRQVNVIRDSLVDNSERIKVKGEKEDQFGIRNRQPVTANCKQPTANKTSGLLVLPTFRLN